MHTSTKADKQIYKHKPVLLDEAIDGLAINANGIYIDGTFGRGGHAAAILEKLSDKGRLIAIDKDPAAEKQAKELCKKDKRIDFYHDSFANIAEVAKELNVFGKVNGILLDLGVSSPQLDEESRGFSFLKDGPLDMRMNPTVGVSAAQWLQTVDEKELKDILRTYGEEKFAGRIARAIVTERENLQITTTKQLAEIVAKANPKWEKHKNPATRSFQAIRIFINQELEDLEKFLEQCLGVLAPQGRLVIISFHSLEDRIVKRFIQKQERGDEFPIDLPIKQSELKPELRRIGRAIKAREEELKTNSRSRSAVLRVAEKLE